MQRREKILLIAVLALLVIWQGQGIVKRTLFGPIDERRSQLQLLQSRVSDKEDQEFNILLAAGRLDEWKRRSLPPNPYDAQRLYQEWLTDTGQLAGLKELKVTPTAVRVSAKKPYVPVQVAVEGKGTIDQVSRFLHQFHRADLLHRLVSLKVESPSAEGNPQFTFAATAEGLALEDAPPRDRLFAEAKLAADLSSSAKEITVAGAAGFPKEPGFRIRLGNEFAVVTKIEGEKWTLSRAAEGTSAASYKKDDVVELAPVHPEYAERTAKDYESLVAQNPFAKPAPPAAAPQKDDDAEFTFLVASIVQDGEPQAWLYDRANNTRTILKVGSSFTVSDITARVLEIDRDRLVLERNESKWTLGLGENLRGMAQTAEAATSASEGQQPPAQPQPTSPASTAG